jgi:Mn2+/Fe2+ NRAMP family transporter
MLAALLKYVLNEGLARYQLASGETLLEGWAHHLGTRVTFGFFLYLLVWTIPVFAALASTTGVAMDLLIPVGSLHPLLQGKLFAGGPDRANLFWSFVLVGVCFALVWWGRYALFEKVMSLLTIVMFGVVIASACMLPPSRPTSVPFTIASWWPADSSSIILSIMGGTGSTVGVMAYSYWMRERQRTSPHHLLVTRVDLALCYLLSGLFGLAILTLAGSIEPQKFAAIVGLPPGESLSQPKIGQVFQVVAYRLSTELPFGESARAWVATAFKGALAATVVSSLLGMMQSIPYLYVDLVGIWRKWGNSQRISASDPASPWYGGFLIAITLLPMTLVVLRTPTFILMVYAIWGSLFIPFLAGTLLVLNNRADWVGDLRNRWGSNLILTLALGVFGWAMIGGVWEWIVTGKPPLPSG